MYSNLTQMRADYSMSIQDERKGCGATGCLGNGEVEGRDVEGREM